jgi:hypothetical protein
MSKKINVVSTILILVFTISSHQAWGKHFFPSPRKDLKYAEAVAGKTRTPPKIDGDLDDWQHAHFFAFDSDKELFRGKGAWKGKDDLSVFWAVMYDNDNFYFSAFVKDDIFAPSPNAGQPWLGDTIFLYIDWNHTHAAIESKPNFALIGGKALVSDWSGGKNPLIAGDSKIVIVPNPDLGKGGMNYEVAIPIKALTKVDIKEKVTIGFTPGYEDGTNDPEKKGLVFMDWGGLDPDTANNLGHLTFGEELSVEPQGKLPIAWGKVKKEHE